MAKLTVKTLVQREAALLAREKALQAREDTATTKAELGTLSQAQLREVNERLIVATVRAQTMTESAEAAVAQMSHMATHDFLTGLPNRSLLTDRLAQAVALTHRHGKRVALMYLDLDHFKQINDSLGHTVGDELLKITARRLQACVRQSDTVCRQGGDEFVVLLAEVEVIGDAALTATKLIEAMAEPYLIDGHRLYVTVSIGVSIFPDDGRDIEALVRNADTAMYHAKKRGRNNYLMFNQGMNGHGVARKLIEEALHHALEQDGLVLHYQPVVNLATGAITGAEALLRLRLSDQSIMHPKKFVSIAEDSGLIVPIGRWVLREACRQAVEWQRSGIGIEKIAVNVSSVEFQSDDFLASVKGVLADTGLKPRCLELELTESGLMQDTDRTTDVLLALRDLGVGIAIDDFGTGYSSLSYLRRFPIATLKVDQSFVGDIRDDMNEGILVNAIVAMGRSLKLRVVAEGIETGEQLSYLKALDCVEGQGYLFGGPVDATEFGKLLVARVASRDLSH